MRVQRVVLTGFMGSGKSTVGRALAHRLGWTFEDLDDAVHRREGLSVPEIFAQLGEPAFRKAETLALTDLLQGTQVVIALGGGAAETPQLQELLRNTTATTVVYLQAPFEVLYNRCLAQAQDPLETARPLLGTRAAVADRYTRRQAIYATIADHAANAVAASPEDVVDEILGLLQTGSVVT